MNVFHFLFVKNPLTRRHEFEGRGRLASLGIPEIFQLDYEPVSLYTSMGRTVEPSLFIDTLA